MGPELQLLFQQMGIVLRLMGHPVVLQARVEGRFGLVVGKAVAAGMVVAEGKVVAGVEGRVGRVEDSWVGNHLGSKQTGCRRFQDRVEYRWGHTGVGIRSIQQSATVAVASGSSATLPVQPWI